VPRDIASPGRLAYATGMRRAWAGSMRLIVALVVSAAGGACQGSSHTASGPAPGTTTSTQPAPPDPARLVITPTRGSHDVPTGTGVTVRGMHATITSVAVSAGGAPVAGRLNRHATAWHSLWTLHPGVRYSVVARGVDGSGRAVMRTSSFRTVRAADTFSATIFEGYHQTYGVGMPIMITFSRPISDRRAVERALELRTSKRVTGAWYWDGDQRVDFRPRGYWRPHTVVHFVGHLDGVEGAPGVYGMHTLTQTFTIGRSLIAVASTQTHHVLIYLDRKLYGDWPISSGKPGDDTPNGTYLTIEKGNPVEMKGPGYDIMVPYSVRFTWSGDYMHDAFWSVGEQGFTNVSHGCVNLSPANAATYYNLAVPGDPVTITGSPRGGSWGNGWTQWFLTWHQLLGGSALHRAVVAGPREMTLVDPASLPPSFAKPPLGAPRRGNFDPTA
jgi:lipoprotein-anchoring transpeptidase ErfK/SrfK